MEGSYPDSGPRYGGSLQFLFPFSFLGGVICIVLFLFVKLRSDFGFLYRRPDQTAPRGISSLVRRLIAIWRLSDTDVARQCGADACDYLMLQRYTCIAFLLASVPGIFVLLPVNLYLGVDNSEPQGQGQGSPDGPRFGGGALDGFARTTALFLRTDSWLLWTHVLFTFLMCAIAHLLFIKLESFLSVTRIRERDASDAISAFTMMIRGVPRRLSADPRSLVEFLERQYPGKVYAVCVPENLSLYLEVIRNLRRARKELDRALTYALHVEDGSDNKYHLHEKDGAEGGDYDYVLIDDDGDGGDREDEDDDDDDDDEDEDGPYGLEVRNGARGTLLGGFKRERYGGLEVVGQQAGSLASSRWCYCRTVVDGSATTASSDGHVVGLKLRRCFFCIWRRWMKRCRTWWRRNVGHLCGLWGVWDEVRWYQGIVSDLESRVAMFGQGAGVHFQRQRHHVSSMLLAGGGNNSTATAKRVLAGMADSVMTGRSNGTSRSRLKKKRCPDDMEQRLGSGIAFVVFKDAFTATRAVQDMKWSRRSVPELETSSWVVERAPAPGGVEWAHVGASAMGNVVRRTLVNLSVLAVLMFWSSPLAMVMAVNNATERLNPEAVTHFHTWLDWARGSNWLAGMVFQVAPNLLIFVAMYVVIPMVIARCARWERHLTISGEQRAILVKTVGFFLVNLLILKSLVETTLESAIAHMSSCYLDPVTGCSGVSRFLKNEWAVSSASNALSFILTAGLLGVSFDLLAPMPLLQRWINSSRRIQTAGSSREDATRLLDEDDAAVAAVAAVGSSSASVDNLGDGIPGVLLPLSYPSDLASSTGGVMVDGAREAAGDEMGNAGEAELENRVDGMAKVSAARPSRATETSLDDVLNLVDEVTTTHGNAAPIPVYDGRDTTPGEATASLLAAAVHGTSTGFGIPMLQASPVPPGATLFDIPQYHAFNLTVFAMALSYSTLAPLVLPTGATYFGYRYLADKYNLLMKVVVPYSSSSVVGPDWGASSHSSPFPMSASDRRLMSTVMRVMRVCLCGYLLVMAVFFFFRGDAPGYQVSAVMVLLAFVCGSYVVGSLFDIPLEGRGFDGFLAQQLGSVDQLVFGSGVGYDVSVGGLQNSVRRS